MSDEGWTLLGALSDAPAPGGIARFVHAGRAVLVCNADGALYALAQRCTHAAWPLDEGPLEGFELVCALHGGRFDVRSGRACALPATKPLERWPLRVRDGRLEIGPPGAQGSAPALWRTDEPKS